MLFNSLEFLLLFLPVTLLVASLLRGRALLFVICASSAVFYAFAGHVWFLIPMFVTATLDYAIGLRIAAAPAARRRFLVISLVANLGLLAFFKYGRMFSAELAWVILPAGISFYTFQTISYVVDVYRGHGEAHRDYLAYLGFVIFFPHLVAGPLTRHDQLVPQLQAIARDGIAVHRRRSGALLFALGLAKKVLIADRIAAFSDPLITHVGGATTLEAWLALLGYTLQIYFDFSGYSDMAVGLGRLFGIELPQNFDSPYKSTSPRDFWRRWHMTLSRWLRDYLYISLGGNRHGRARMRFNMLLTMTLGGLWHGAAWTFAMWGLYHGVLLALHAAIEEPWGRMPIWIQRLITLALVMLGWVLFRSPDFASALDWYTALFGGGSAAFTGIDLGTLTVLVAGGLGIAQVAPNTWQLDLDAAPPWSGIVIGILFAAAIVGSTLSSKFLYFQF